LDQTLALDGLADPAEVARSLRQYQPHVITGMPGMLCRVADHLLQSGDDRIRPELLVVGGEVLTPIMHSQLSRAFAAPVRQTYASHEFPLLGWECTSSGDFHVSGDGVLIEVLRDGLAVAPGESGEVVATNLSAYAMPFIRYRLGDLVIRGQDSCACGQPFPTIRSIQGRMIDYFTLPDGRTLHPYEILGSLISGGDSWMRQYQLLQEQTNRIVLRIQPFGEVQSSQIERVERSAQDVLGPEVNFQVKIMERLPLEPSGKFRASRSLVRPGTAHV
jgi:phenylacetate-CoA ligase